MSNQIPPALQAPQPTVTSAPAPIPTTEASHANISRPATVLSTAPTATSTALNATAMAHMQGPFALGGGGGGGSVLPATEEPQTLNEKLNAAERYWKFKGVFQLVAIITSLIGIGTIGWCVNTSPQNGYTYGYDSLWSLWPSLITFAISIVWCLACILVLVYRKCPVHPGLRVAMDLLIWLGFITTALFAMVALTDLLSWGEYGDLGYGYYSSYGDYVMADNGTWVWQRDSDYTSYTRDCDRNSTSSRSSSYDGYGNTFQNCAEQDAYINKLWIDKPHRESTEMTGVVCQFFGIVMHFALFVWACVDCHYYNRNKISKDAEKIAAGIVQTMITNGAVIPPPGQAHMRPAAPWGQQQMGYYQLSQQGQAYPLATMYSQRVPQGQPMPQQYRAPQAHMTPAAGVAAPNNEKSEGPRYA